MRSKPARKRRSGRCCAPRRGAASSAASCTRANGRTSAPWSAWPNSRGIYWKRGVKLAELSPGYANRRRRLAQAMGAGIAVVPTAPERVRNRDSHYPYRFDSHFYYLTGFTEPEAVLVLLSNKSILFCREKNIEREIWDGFRYGPEAARSEE